MWLSLEEPTGWEWVEWVLARACRVAAMEAELATLGWSTRCGNLARSGYLKRLHRRSAVLTGLDAENKCTRSDLAEGLGCLFLFITILVHEHK